jgi:hypothetical protein
VKIVCDFPVSFADIALALIAFSCVAVSANRDVDCTDTFFRVGRHADTCTEFFICMDSSRVDFFCDEGDIFDETRVTCRRGDAETCVFMPIPIPTNACDGIFKAIRPHPDPYLCGQFYMCMNDNIVEFRCQEGYIYSDYAQRCIPGDSETCQETESAPYNPQELFLNAIQME